MSPNTLNNKTYRITHAVEIVRRRTWDPVREVCMGTLILTEIREYVRTAVRIVWTEQGMVRELVQHTQREEKEVKFLYELPEYESKKHNDLLNTVRSQAFAILDGRPKGEKDTKKLEEEVEVIIPVHTKIHTHRFIQRCAIMRICGPEI